MLDEAAADAPSTPGVYFFLGDGARLLYIGKAGNIRSRLRQHAQAASDAKSPRSVRRGEEVREVRWEEWPDEESAAAREADLIVAFQPVLNAALVTEARWTYIAVAPTPESPTRLQFSLSDTPAKGAGNRVYGCFPHLAVGVSSRRGIACSEGYSAFLRALWAASDDGGSFPRALSSVCPPEVAIEVSAALQPALHRFLAGTGPRLLDDVERAAAHRPAYLLPGLRRDLVSARKFYENGPKAMRDLRVRHGRRAGLLSRRDVEVLLLEEVEASIGAFTIPVLEDPTGGILGPRASRAHALRAAARTRSGDGQ